MGLPNTPYPALIGQRLAVVRVFEPWQACLAPTADAGPAPLFGALALVFERQALLLTSPLAISGADRAAITAWPMGEWCPWAFA